MPEGNGRRGTKSQMLSGPRCMGAGAKKHSFVARCRCKCDAETGNAVLVAVKHPSETVLQVFVSDGPSATVCGSRDVRRQLILLVDRLIVLGKRRERLPRHHMHHFVAAPFELVKQTPEALRLLARSRQGGAGEADRAFSSAGFTRYDAPP
jgi:hypothetical protein